MSTQTASNDPSMEEILASIRRIISQGDDDVEHSQQDQINQDADAKDNFGVSGEKSEEQNASLETELSGDLDANEESMQKLQQALFGAESQEDKIKHPSVEVSATQYPEIQSHAILAVHSSHETNADVDVKPEQDDLSDGDNLSVEPELSQSPSLNHIDFSSLANPVVKQTFVSSTSVSDEVEKSEVEPGSLESVESFGQSEPSGDIARAEDVSTEEVSAFNDALMDRSSEIDLDVQDDMNIAPAEPAEDISQEQILVEEAATEEAPELPDNSDQDKQLESLNHNFPIIAKKINLETQDVSTEELEISLAETHETLSGQNNRVEQSYEQPTESEKEIADMSVSPKQSEASNIHTIVSTQAEVETRDAFKLLSKALMPEDGQRNFEDVVTELLRPMMKEWMDQNFPQLVEKLVKEEIQRLSK